MQPPPSLKCVPRYPVTASTAAAALAVTLMWRSSRQIDLLVMNSQVWDNLQLWRALTSTLPHVNFFHLAFNLYWLWALGTMVEVSARMRRAPARAWFNLGIAYQRLGKEEEALAAYKHAAAMPDATSEMQQTARELKEYRKLMGEQSR